MKRCGILGDRVSTSDSVREHHSHGESWHAPGLPDFVVFPTSTEEVSAIVKLCAAQRMPIVPFGMGSSLEGHVNAINGGVSIDLTRMTTVLRLSPEDLDITVEAGLTRLKLDAHLKNTGLMFPIDPGADATHRRHGRDARLGNHRGSLRDDARQRAGHDGGPCRRQHHQDRRPRPEVSSGYDLTRLFVGSEGTLGVITELTLRLYGRPEAVRAAVCPFESMAGAANTVIQTIQLGIPVARIEIIDEAQLRVVNAYSKTDYPLAPTLFFEFHGISESSGRGSDPRRRGDRRASTAPRASSGPSSLEDRNTLWQARHNAYYATVASRPGARAWTTDICVPISHLAECILETQEDLKDANVVAPLVGHAGDGNFHLIIMLNPDDPKEFDTVTRISERLVERALKFGGTCSGEHGVGFGKLKYLAAEHGAALDVMRSIKRAIDPNNLMNPGKLIPEV